ncbi:hypothetical protein D1B33_08560 [Lysinibacillus yapensis]|uniref:SCP domain-containing protein n=1 Tax=Ureibacillus yapensis TaxID=2304605 RepID=A0A396S909_9BACL|nr:CAP domain-containing protein [Lysinibacillus yapensis]RHW37572.1 hypothetical protein D1B33_08560 [Lysinibacillus yapensis]
MKKWVITFCALGFISTQAPAADAASINEGQEGFTEKQIVKVVNLNEYKNLLKEFKEDYGVTYNANLQDLSKVGLSQENIEKLVESAKKELQKQENGQEVAKETPEKQALAEKAPAAPVKKAEKAATPAPEKAAPAQPTETVKETEETKAPVANDDSVSAFETQVVELTNAERAKAGLAPLEAYAPLMDVAEAKSEDMAANNYFSHNSPTLGSPFDQMKAAGISYRAAGENIAQGQRTPEEVVQAWMNSEGHRANILNANFTHIGVGHVENGNYWTQQFIQL